VARTRRRTLGLWVSCALAAVGTWTAVGAVLDAASVPTYPTSIGVVQQLAQRMERAKARARETPDAFEVVFLGDSTAGGQPAEHWVPVQLEQAVRRIAVGGPPVLVHSLVRGGIGPLDRFFLADMVAEAEPDLVVYHLNPLAFSETWGRTMSRLALAGWVAPSRLAKALRLPLHRFGLTTDRLLFSMALVNAGASEPWRELSSLRVRTRRGFRTAARRLDDRSISGSPVDSQDDAGRRLEPPQGAHPFGGFLDGLDDHPLLPVLGETVRIFTDAGARVLLYVIPMNLERLESQGVLDRERLAHSIATLEAVVRKNGGEFADFHDLLPGAAFLDDFGHVQPVGELIPQRRLAQALAPLVLRARER
jgi:hypothetical protein